MANPRISMSIGRKINDGNFGSYDFNVGAEYDLGPDESPGEALTELHEKLHYKLDEILVKEGIIAEPESD